MSTAAPRPDLREAASGPLAARLSPRYLDEHCILPLSIGDDGVLTAAAGGPVDATVLDELSRVFGRRLRLVEMPAGEIQAAILSVQRQAAPDAVAAEAEAQIEGGIEELHAHANDAPVVKLVNVTLLDAARARASDIHFEATPSGLRIRFRLDGVLQDVSLLPRQYQSAVISRVKIMAGLNIAERRLPQDGRARIRLADRELDLRVSTVPALHGEGVVLRLLDYGAAARDLAELGMNPEARERFIALIERSRGIILVTGPTGSGKTTTLYGALLHVNRPGVKIVTVEDPVEYQIAGVTQIPVNRKAGLGFATALRSILRHDPDVIMVGEMRDRETAEIAIQAALTGHLVFATLHTDDAPSAVTRLVNMGIEPYLVAATVQGIVAQRLVRLRCNRCNASGCDACSRTGYAGRTGIYELLVVTDEFRDAVAARESLAVLRALARAAGMETLVENGMRKVEAGLTTREEVLRVASDDVNA